MSGEQTVFALSAAVLAALLLLWLVVKSGARRGRHRLNESWTSSPTDILDMRAAWAKDGEVQLPAIADARPNQASSGQDSYVVDEDEPNLLRPYVTQRAHVAAVPDTGRRIGATA
ncbi:hypothetical protein EV192_12819 [Actinocrispum wychmicini]|uniref:Uncharacterized protein n=1 Tax=Actinocrispum wychmicini TaxID=1213861 RepID=A0A4R2IHT7_9PSEU|nr:hypothetical protein EV192_12819 [Actinocrispum wychmicini]